MGDLVVNTAIHNPRSTEHVLVFVPTIKYLLVPLEYTFTPTGHLPAYLDAFTIPPSYYYPFLPSPQYIFLDLTPYGEQAMKSLRLAYDRRDMTVSSGVRLSAKRYLHVAGFEVFSRPGLAPEWVGMISLEAEGTAEGRIDLENRLHRSNVGESRTLWPWEVVREKSLQGQVWLRLVKR
ncbi:hypothetical protein TREMEDRAFT_56844 [Tremella mesenterica DSM 1558]|nr:uncharacterized protein TREMEDRAFT_56844 [Tremella mesenterica DSM 1558]EIW70208.1 hypothetical protein TREMEDRAFT_56844 [Tremella mesenterica DSM 1558]